MAGLVRPLVSVVTPTWQRPELLAETIRHLREQDYPNIEHVVISDGEDGRLHWSEVGPPRGVGRPNILMRHVSLGRNWSGLMPSSFGIAPLLVGYLMARGEYVMNWSDDDRALTQSHISRLVDLLESSGADFAYPKVRIWRNGNPAGPETKTIGTDPPMHSQITHMLFRASCLHRFGMPRWSSHPVDWSLVSDWMNAGATWAMLDDCTFSHRLDL
jgi:cellulose synthase/poly-beta-1,6-N-acetylglucosamine synthase-like glycosyltransferase